MNFLPIPTPSPYHHRQEKKQYFVRETLIESKLDIVAQTGQTAAWKALEVRANPKILETGSLLFTISQGMFSHFN